MPLYIYNSQYIWMLKWDVKSDIIAQVLVKLDRDLCNDFGDKKRRGKIAWISELIIVSV